MKERFVRSPDCYRQFFMNSIFLYENMVLSPFSLFVVILITLATNPPAKVETYTLLGESSTPSTGEFIRSPGLVGIYYGHLPRDGHPRQRVTLVLVADSKSGAPKEYTLEQIGVGKIPNARYVTKGSWKLVKDPKRPEAVIYELDAALRSRWRPPPGCPTVAPLAGKILP